jgi:hypothetical protein
VSTLQNDGGCATAQTGTVVPTQSEAFVIIELSRNFFIGFGTNNNDPIGASGAQEAHSQTYCVETRR